MYGMRLLDSSVPEVRCLLIAVFKKIRDSSASLSPQEFSNYLFGFQSMRFISPEVLMLLKLLEDKIVKRRVDVAIKFKPQEVSMALVGLQYVAQALPSSLMFFEFISAAVKNRDRRFSAEEIAHCLHCLKSFEDSNLPARELVAALTNCLDETARAEELSPAQIAVALYGLRKMATGSPEVLSLISKLTACAASSSRAFEGKDVHNSLYGINSLSGDIAAVKELLFVVGSKIMIGPGYLKSREIAGALYGLRYTSSDNSAARLILDKLTNQLIINRSLDEPYISAGDISAMIYSLHEKQMEWDAVRSIIGVLTDEMLFSLRYQNVHFSTPELSMIFYGVKLISCYEYDEFNKLMHALASVLTAHVGLIDAQCVGNLFYGLHSMSSTHPECRQLLLAVSNKIERCSDDVALSGQAIGNALYGCQGMDCIHVEVRQLISALTKLMSSQKNKGRVKLTGQEIGNALYGLQHMSNTTDEVASLLAALVDCLPPTELSTCVDQMNFSDVGMALFGLHDMTVKNEVLDKLLQELLRRLNNICALTIGVDNSQLTMLSQNITLLLYLNNKATSWVEEHKEVLENANNAIVNKLKCNGSYMHYGSVASVIEGRIFLIFKEALIANRNVLSVTNNESLLCFEADIAIRFLTPDGNEALINIEIDGPYHKRSSLFTRLRDEFLYSKSEIHTLRLPVRGSFLSESYSINLSAAASNIKAATAAEQALDVIRGSDVSFTGSPVELLTSLLVQPISTLNNQYTVEVK